MSDLLFLKDIFPFGINENAEKLLYCFYHAGATSEVFRKWAGINNNIAIIPIEISGRGRRFKEPYSKSVSNIADEISDAILKSSGKRQIFIYGHSFGSINAFETVLSLEHKGAEVSRLIVSGRGAPFDKDKSGFSLEMGRDALIDLLYSMGGVDSELLSNEFFREYFMPIIENDLILTESYKYNGEKVKCPITAHCGTNDPETDSIQMSHWKSVTDNSFDEQVFEGGHFFVFDNKDYLNKLISIVSGG